jgi:hypothetical protein
MQFDGVAWEGAINEAAEIYRANGLGEIADHLVRSVNSPQFVIETLLNAKGPYNVSPQDPVASKRLGEVLDRIEAIGRRAFS